MKKEKGNWLIDERDGNFGIIALGIIDLLFMGMLPLIKFMLK